MIWLAVLLGLAALASAPFAAEALRRPADPARAPGRIHPFPEGATHCRWHGPPAGRVAVCIHGLTTPEFVFDDLARDLVAQGFRVLTYDLPGRGFSAPRPGPQDSAFFLAQLTALLAAEGIDEIELLVGYSMGGAIATAFVAAEPDRVERLVLLAPAGLYHDPGPLAGTLRRLPGLGDWVMLVLGGAMLRRGVDDSLGDFARAQRAETRRRGYLPAVLSSMRNILTVHLGREHREVAVMGVPVLAIWGEEDDVIPVSNVGRLAELNRKAHQVTLREAGHMLPKTHHPQVAKEIRAFLSETAW